MKYLLIVLVVATLSGCSLANEAIDKAKWVTDYVCTMTPAEKTALAERVDKATYPNRIRVECAE